MQNRNHRHRLVLPEVGLRKLSSWVCEACPEAGLLREPGLCSGQVKQRRCRPAGGEVWGAPKLHPGASGNRHGLCRWMPAMHTCQTPDEHKARATSILLRTQCSKDTEEKLPSPGPSPPIHSAHSSPLQRECSSSCSNGPTSLLRALDACCATSMHAPGPRFLARCPGPGHIHSALQLSYLPLPPPLLTCGLCGRTYPI